MFTFIHCSDICIIIVPMAESHFSYVYISLFSLPLLQYDGGQLSNVVKVESLHSTLREDETVFWTKYLLSSLRSFWRGNNQQQTRSFFIQFMMNTYIPTIV